MFARHSLLLSTHKDLMTIRTIPFSFFRDPVTSGSRLRKRMPSLKICIPDFPPPTTLPCWMDIEGDVCSCSRKTTARTSDYTREISFFPSAKAILSEYQTPGESSPKKSETKKEHRSNFVLNTWMIAGVNFLYLLELKEKKNISN